MQKIKERHRIIGKVRGKGLAWIPEGNILRLAPLLIITEELSETPLAIIDEAIAEMERHFGFI